MDLLSNKLKGKNTLFNVVIGLWIGAALIALSLLGVIAYVAHHFLSKIW